MSSEGGGFYGPFFVGGVCCGVGGVVVGRFIGGLMEVLMGVVDAIFVKVHD